MSDAAGWSKLDEEERVYAPEDLPLDQQARVQADEGTPQVVVDGTPMDISGARAEGSPVATAPFPSITHEPNAGVPRDPGARTPDVVNNEP